MLGLSQSTEVALGVLSGVMFVATVIAIPVILVKVPDDYFTRPRKVRSLPVKVLRTAVGGALVVLGLLMLVLPGQGVLTILVGLSVLDLPIKDRLVARILGMPRVRRAIDKLRHKAGKGSLLVPGQGPAPAAGQGAESAAESAA